MEELRDVARAGQRLYPHAMPAPMLMTDGPFAGWYRWRGHFENRFTDLVGPHFYRQLDDGRIECGMIGEERHLNGLGFLHGGMIMAFVDMALFSIARPLLSKRVGAVTLSCDTHFLGSGVAGTPLIGTGEILRETGKLIFVRGLLTQEGGKVAAFTATLRKVQHKP